MLNRMIKRIKDDREGRESSLAAAEEAESRVELFTSDAREDGLRMDTDRYLRMNRANRQELVLPKLGVLDAESESKQTRAKTYADNDNLLPQIGY
ncbi:hypothetical protein NFJ02_27g63280 [Pycnococcus provasolii]